MIMYFNKRQDLRQFGESHHDVFQDQFFSIKNTINSDDDYYLQGLRRQDLHSLFDMSHKFQHTNMFYIEQNESTWIRQNLTLHFLQSHDDVFPQQSKKLRFQFFY